jgi:hypothetical protein
MPNTLILRHRFLHVPATPLSIQYWCISSSHSTLTNQISPSPKLLRIYIAKITQLNVLMTFLVYITLACLSLPIFWVFFPPHLRRRDLLYNNSNEDGCAPPKSLPSRDPLFGLDTFFATMRAMKNHCRMQTVQVHTRTYGNTFQSFPFGRRVITTTSARNIQHVLSLEQEKFGVSLVRGPAVAMTGPGIISNDGKVWEHARAMIRPCFTRSQIADPEMFDVHFERFLALLPEKGTAVDLQPLFDRLVWQWTSIIRAATDDA